MIPHPNVFIIKIELSRSKIQRFCGYGRGNKKSPQWDCELSDFVTFDCVHAERMNPALNSQVPALSTDGNQSD
jgi:hypothetical protein